MHDRMTSDKGRDYAIRLHLRQGVDCAFELIEGETHTSVIPAAMALAPRFCRDGTSA